MLRVFVRCARRVALPLVVFSLLAACDGGSVRSGATTHEESGTIGPAGGIVRGPGGLTLRIPEGALTTDTTVRIAAVYPAEAPALPRDLEAAGSVYTFLPHGLAFAKPVIVTVPFEDDTSTVMLMSAEPSEEWKVVPGASVEKGTLTALVKSLSFFVATRAAPLA